LHQLIDANGSHFLGKAFQTLHQTAKGETPEMTLLSFVQKRICVLSLPECLKYGQDFVARLKVETDG
jgi:hypothetical protein